MNAGKNTKEQNLSSVSIPSSSTGSSLFFAAIVYTGNEEQLTATLNSVQKQKVLGGPTEIHLFYDEKTIPVTAHGNHVIAVPFKSKEDFFLKFTGAIEQSTAQYCITLWSGDELFEGAFDSVERIFGKYKQINWLTGIQTFRAKGGFNITLGTTAMRRWSYKIYEHNLYKSSGRYIPPASTFWRRDIWPSVSAGVYFTGVNGFCEDLWPAFFKTQKLYTCKTYFSSSANFLKPGVKELKLPKNYSLIEDNIFDRIKEFLFINNIPYLRLFYRNESKLAPVIRFDHGTQSYYLSEY